MKKVEKPCNLCLKFHEDGIVSCADCTCACHDSKYWCPCCLKNVAAYGVVHAKTAANICPVCKGRIPEKEMQSRCGTDPWLESNSGLF